MSGSRSQWTKRYAFLGVTDPVARFGYNIGAGGNPLTAGEPAIWFAFETNYAVSAGQRQLEYYCQVLPSAHTGFRPFMATYNETTDAATFIIYSDSFSIYSRDGLTAKCLVPITGYAMQFQSDVLIQNTASLKFLATGDASPRYVLGFSGDGSFNFQSTDTVTPRSFYITSSGEAQKHQSIRDGGRNIQRNLRVQRAAIDALKPGTQVLPWTPLAGQTSAHPGNSSKAQLPQRASPIT